MRNWSDMGEMVASHGCPIGTLCAELDKNDDGLDRRVPPCIGDPRSTGPRRSSAELGRRDARDLALALFAGIQGAALLANTFRDPTILTRQARHLERWIDSLTRE